MQTLKLCDDFLLRWLADDAENVLKKLSNEITHTDTPLIKNSSTARVLTV